MVKCRIPASLLRPPHRVTHPEKADALTHTFLEHGWDASCPDLVGYQEVGYVQLLTGSHRYAAALRADLFVPVRLHTRAEVVRAWGDLNRWRILIEQT